MESTPSTLKGSLTQPPVSDPFRVEGKTGPGTQGEALGWRRQPFGLKSPDEAAEGIDSPTAGMGNFMVAPSPDDLLPEYDPSQLRGGVRGKYFARYQAGPLVRLDPDVAASFPTGVAVNTALRLLADVVRRQTTPAPTQAG